MSKEAYDAAIETFNRFPKNIRLMLHKDIQTAFINRVKAMTRILKNE